MKAFKDKVAVVTGGASGIGLGIARRCAEEGMKVVLADIEKESLSRAEEEMKAGGAEVLALLTDVSRADHVESLARRTLDAFGAVHLLCNNAGVETAATVCESTLADWEWVLGVNLWGVIHGVRTFAPIMLAQDAGGHIVNTSSAAGLTANPYLGIYKVSKNAVISLSETLWCEMRRKGARIGVSVLCPEWVSTRLLDSDRNRPADLRNACREKTPGEESLRKAFREALESGMRPETVADHVFRAVREDRLYVFTHPESKARIRTRMENLLGERNPETK